MTMTLSENVQNGTLSKTSESIEQPKMVEILVDGSAYQSAFCFAMGVENTEGRFKKLLTTIIAGPDSAIQSIKAAIDSGTYGFSFGYGEKQAHSYKFHKEAEIFTERGKYTHLPMSINNRKVLAVVHNDVLEGNYVMSFDENPAQDVRALLGGRNYGLPILEEWSDTILDELYYRQYVEDKPLYYDPNIFPNGFHLLEMKLDEVQADNFLSFLISSKRISFPKQGTGQVVEEIDNLTDYMTAFSDDMLRKLSQTLNPTHNPLHEEVYSYFDDYNMSLFPVQGHVATAISKRFFKQKAVILQGEMSSGKSKMMTAVADGYMKMKGKKGFFGVIMVPPSLTDKWSNEEIYDLLPQPNSKVIHVKTSKDLMEYHRNWIRSGRPEPEVPTFFVISFTTMRSDASIRPAVQYHYKRTEQQVKNGDEYYRRGYICPDCGAAHKVTEETRIEVDDEGNEHTVHDKRFMEEEEFGKARRLTSHNKPANAFCSECGGALWTRSVPNRYSSFKEWAKHERKLVKAIDTGDRFEVTKVQNSQPEIKKATGSPRRVAAIEYIRRKMKGFFDIAIIDEVHELKGANTAQGNSLGSLAAASKRVIAGTGTLFGGKAEDIYYILWRLFPHEMVKAGYKYEEVNKWNHEYGNVEKTTYSQSDSDMEFSNKQSRGGRASSTEKVVPGISPFVFGRFLMQNVVLVRLLDVWPDPVELVDVPTIFVDMTNELREMYVGMKATFDRAIESNRGKKDGITNLWLLYTDTGIAYLDNPFRFPDVTAKDKKGVTHHIWRPAPLPEDYITPKEEKLMEIAKGEILEKRPMIIYVRDTGSSKEERDIQPRLKKVLEENVEGAKVAILRSNTTKTDQRSHWLKKKVEKEGYNIIISSVELVKVGLDLLCTPTILFYQFTWSMFTMAQAAKRAFRIGQLRECRLYYLAFGDSFQEMMAHLIAQKNKASQAINGDVSSDGLNAMLGDDGDLQSMLIKSIQKGDNLKGSSEEWIATTTDRAREILAGIGKAKAPSSSELIAQLLSWGKGKNIQESTVSAIREKESVIMERLNNNSIPGFQVKDGVLEVDEIMAFGFDFFSDGDLINHLIGIAPKAKGYQNIKFEVKVVDAKISRKNKKKVASGQLAIDLFGGI